MATAHTLYENKVLENKITDLVNTKLETRSLMTMDYSLAESAGLKKVVNKYTSIPARWKSWPRRPKTPQKAK